MKEYYNINYYCIMSPVSEQMEAAKTVSFHTIFYILDLYYLKMYNNFNTKIISEF